MQEIVEQIKAKLAELGVNDPGLLGLIDGLQNEGAEGGAGESELEAPSKDDLLMQGFEKEAGRHMPGFKLDK